MVRVIVEKNFDPPITEEKWNRDLQRGIPCHTMNGVRWIRSLMSRDRSRVFCEFEAPDVETVRRSFRKIGLPFVKIWAVDVLEPDDSDESGPVRYKGWSSTPHSAEVLSGVGAYSTRVEYEIFGG